MGKRKDRVKITTHCSGCGRRFEGRYSRCPNCGSLNVAISVRRQ